MRNLIGIFVEIIIAISIITTIYLLLLFIINRLGRFAGFLLNRKYKDDLDILYHHYSQVLSSDNHCEDYALNKKHRQREGKDYIFEGNYITKPEILEWTITYTYLDLAKEKIEKIFKVILNTVFIIFLLSTLPFVIRFYTVNYISNTTKVITTILFTLFFKSIIREVSNFKVTGYKLNIMNYNKITR